MAIVSDRGIELSGGRIIAGDDEEFPRDWLRDFAPGLSEQLIADCPDPVTIQIFETKVAEWVVHRPDDFAAGAEEQARRNRERFGPAPIAAGGPGSVEELAMALAGHDGLENRGT